MNWIGLKALAELYNNRKTRIKSTLLKDSYFKHLLSTNELEEIGDFYFPGNNFDRMYSSRHLDKITSYKIFLEENKLLKPQTRFEEEDIIELMDMKARMESGELLPIRNQIIEYEESVRNVSSMFFKNEKYLLGKNALIDSIKQILEIDELADDKDQQYMYRLECKTPNLIVLCENLDFLKKPTRPRKYGYELWYAGGKNIEKLNYTDNRNLPIYYSADWDYDGLLIFNMVRKKIPNIKLLIPNAEPKSIIGSEHKSLWKNRESPKLYSNLDISGLSNSHKKTLKTLIEKNDWITEEDNDLVKMVSST